MNNLETNRSYRKKWNKNNPWCLTFYSIKGRIEDKSNTSYKRYGGRGIRCLITKEELKKLWIRDKASLMKRPSIDRKNSNGNYTFRNCRYIEISENSKKGGWLGGINRWRKDKGLKLVDNYGKFGKQKMCPFNPCNDSALWNGLCYKHNALQKYRRAKGIIKKMDEKLFYIKKGWKPS